MAIIFITISAFSWDILSRWAAAFPCGAVDGGDVRFVERHGAAREEARLLAGVGGQPGKCVFGDAEVLQARRYADVGYQLAECLYAALRGFFL